MAGSGSEGVGGTTAWRARPGAPPRDPRRTRRAATHGRRLPELRLDRQVWVVAHRWAGLTLTVFLVIVGFTGALLPWNTQLTWAGRPTLAAVAPPHPHAPVLDAVTLAERVERATGARVGYIDFQVPADHVATLFVTSPPGRARAYDVVWADPYTGAVRLAWRYGNLADGPQAIMSFLYRLHQQLALGRVGEVTLGIAALVWTVDCFVGFYLTLPIRRRPLPGEPAAGAPGWWARWRPAWAVRRRGGSYKLTFDLHRAGGLWVWPVLFVFAWSSVGLNLREVSTPVMSVFGGTAYPDLPKAASPLPRPPLDLRAAQARGDALLRGVGRREGFRVVAPAGLSYYPAQAAYRYNARSTWDVVSEGGRTTVYFSAVDGRLIRFEPPVDRNPANGFMSWLEMLHFAEVLGPAYRVFVSVMGALVVMLSVTGVLIWMRKRSARLLKAGRLEAAGAQPRRFSAT